MKWFLCLFTVLFSFSSLAVTSEAPSLPSLMQKEFNGHDLRRVKILDKNVYYTRYMITYMSGDLKISGVMNVPTGKGPFPVVILNHGFINPKYYTLGRGLKREQDYLAHNGYIVIHPDYRNHAFSDKDEGDTAGFRLGYVEDAINCVEAVKQSHLKFFDKDKIGMLGHSMGGGVVLNVLVTRPDLIKAAVLFAPVSSDYKDNFTKWLWRRKHSPEVAEKIIARYGSPEANPEFWNNLSAVNFFGRVKAPVQIHHGTGDESVPLAWSERTAAALKAKNKEVELYKYQNGKHEFVAYWPLVMSRTKKFFDRYLKGEKI